KVAVTEAYVVGFAMFAAPTSVYVPLLGLHHFQKSFAIFNRVLEKKRNNNTGQKQTVFPAPLSLVSAVEAMQWACFTLLWKMKMCVFTAWKQAEAASKPVSMLQL